MVSMFMFLKKMHVIYVCRGLFIYIGGYIPSQSGTSETISSYICHPCFNDNNKCYYPHKQCPMSNFNTCLMYIRFF